MRRLRRLQGPRCGRDGVVLASCWPNVRREVGEGQDSAGSHRGRAAHRRPLRHGSREARPSETHGDVRKARRRPLLKKLSVYPAVLLARWNTGPSGPGGSQRFADAPRRWPVRQPHRRVHAAALGGIRQRLDAKGRPDSMGLAPSAPIRFRPARERSAGWPITATGPSAPLC